MTCDFSLHIYSVYWSVEEVRFGCWSTLNPRPQLVLLQSWLWPSTEGFNCALHLTFHWQITLIVLHCVTRFYIHLQLAGSTGPSLCADVDFRCAEQLQLGQLGLMSVLLTDPHPGATSELLASVGATWLTGRSTNQTAPWKRAVGSDSVNPEGGEANWQAFPATRVAAIGIQTVDMCGEYWMYFTFILIKMNCILFTNFQSSEETSYATLLASLV